ncbi:MULTISPECIES: ABC transporter permease [unclassified Paenibacillus]|uniref:ABC transporter permease n=1 Tax=unclassified Paenibacillus TaxID=185978 RepID=UPI00070CB810|nr:MULTISPECIES: ABC transporter permease [unclassified Paenibacillus]KQX64738.1 diguanylate cyclase [Paenibacillus sp. Root444D2]KRE51991.1 diguanylate cyclase [Paenibacillus sp. Soil724D2]
MQTPNQSTENNYKFAPVSNKSLTGDKIVRPSLNYWQDAWRRLKKNRLAMAGLIILVALIVFAIIVPFVSSYDYQTQNLKVKNVPPSGEHWFGTDDFGRDLWTRVWWGTRISLFIGIIAAIIDLVIGVIYGGISAYYGGKVDEVMQRTIEIVYAIPFLLIAILLIMVIGSGIPSIILAMAITGWVPMARLVRGQMLTLKEQEFVLASRTLGASPMRIIMRSLIPNALGIIIVQITFVVPAAIFTEAFLSFIGLGVKPPLASLGNLLSDGANYIRLYPHRLIFPTIIFSLILLSFNLLGDGLRDALDPKMRK